MIEPSADPLAERPQAAAASAAPSTDWTVPAPVENHFATVWKDATAQRAPAEAPASIAGAAYASPAMLGAPDRLSTPAQSTAGISSAAGWSPAAAAPERSRRSVILACVVGAAIAAAIVALAFTFRPVPEGAPAPAPEAPASVPAR